MGAPTSQTGGPALGSISESLGELARIGGGGADGGVTRVAWSPELFRAYEWVAERMRALGLDVEVDAAGNLLGCWQAGSGKAVLVGSHLDTVPTGGALDGVLGVVSAVHAIAQLKQEGYQPGRPLWVAAFMDEEGTRFGTALFGSRAFVGEDVAGLGDRVDADGLSLSDAMAGAGFSLERVNEACRVDEIGAYLELHIEQGPVLEAEQLEIGIVTSIVGLRGYRVRLFGQSNHAGTTPMHLRRDAFAGAARIALALRDKARSRESVTVNVGRVRVLPGGANVVPGYADFTIDLRATTPEALVAMAEAVQAIVEQIAVEEGLAVELEETFALEPLELDSALVDIVDGAAVAEGVSGRRMPSGAGHDAMVVGRQVPAAMLFVPSCNGVSHSPDESSRPEHLELGVRVLAAALRESLRAEKGG